MELDFLQKKYPEFVYESFDWELAAGDLAAVFCFRLGDIEFHPSVIIHGVNQAQIDRVGEAAVSNLIFNMGLAEIPSYWKAACSPKIIINAGYLDREQIIFWQGLFFNMGQFFYENKIPFIKPLFEIIPPKPKKAPLIAKRFLKRYLVPLGGGKDSLVTFEALKEGKNEVTTFTFNANTALKRVAKEAGADNIFVERKIDKRLIELNAQGYLNGHTPFSSVLAVLGVGLAAIFDCGYVAISQERSSNEGNVEYLGKAVNHQYSKTFEFENKFRKYSKACLAKNVDYFSFLRPLYEIQISKIFCRYPKYFGSFLSCNKPFTIAARESSPNAMWCGQCSKCLSVYSMIYPFAGKEAAVKIFGGDLFDNNGLLPTMRELLGQTESKPMECVGTFEEMRAAFYFSLQVCAGEKPALLDYFQKKILPEYPRIGIQSKKIMAAWTSGNNLPKKLAAMLKKSCAEHPDNNAQCCG
ncbi:MAG: hypothetical protein WCX69_00230 [Candidatus Paceibacterota bacterium]